MGFGGGSCLPPPRSPFEQDTRNQRAGTPADRRRVGRYGTTSLLRGRGWPHPGGRRGTRDRGPPLSRVLPAELFPGLSSVDRKPHGKDGNNCGNGPC